jgi:hypothetical protein
MRYPRLAGLHRFRRDEGGQSLLVFALVFPLVLTAILVTTAILQIMVIKSSISSGVYDVVQELTYRGGDKQEAQWKSPTLRADAKQMIVVRMASGQFLQQYLDGTTDDLLAVTITPPPFKGRRTLCETDDPARAIIPEDLRFTVSASLDLNPLKQIPFLGGLGHADQIGPLTLQETAYGFVDCPRNWQPIQKREGCLFPGFCDLFR